VDRRVLEELIGHGLTQRELAAALGVSQGTIRYWLRRLGLKTRPTSRIEAGRRARELGQRNVLRDCKRHGSVRFVLDAQGIYRCTRCRAEGVSKRRRRVKEILVAEAGGRCALCGYSRHPAALEFHHTDPASKRFALGTSGLTRAIAAMREEAAKCVLLCSNCHAEVEVGFAVLPPDADTSRG
jgi:transposase